jgi:hypothetical protein
VTTSTRYQTPRRARKFTQAGALLGERIKGVGAKRGFAETRLLTRWADICGPDLAKLARPVKVTYGRKGFGATLVLACIGARAPELQMQAERIRERVNACYGYNAISRVQIVQEDMAGFAEKQREFSGQQTTSETHPGTDPVLRAKAATEVDGVANSELRQALEALGTNILTRKAATGTDEGETDEL